MAHQTTRKILLGEWNLTWDHPALKWALVKSRHVGMLVLRVKEEAESTEGKNLIFFFFLANTSYISSEFSIIIYTDC